jgi:hypothetical protein
MKRSFDHSPDYKQRLTLFNHEYEKNRKQDIDRSIRLVIY